MSFMEVQMNHGLYANKKALLTSEQSFQKFIE